MSHAAALRELTIITEAVQRRAVKRPRNSNYGPPRHLSSAVADGNRNRFSLRWVSEFPVPILRRHRRPSDNATSVSLPRRDIVADVLAELMLSPQMQTFCREHPEDQQHMMVQNTQPKTDRLLMAVVAVAFRRFQSPRVQKLRDTLL